MADVIPRREVDLLTWSRSFSNHVAATFAQIGLTAEDSARLQGLVGAFDVAMTESSDPATRTRVKVVGKNAVRDELIVEVRGLIRRVQACPAVTDETRAELGLSVRDTVLSRTGAPVTRPCISLVNVSGLSQSIRIGDLESPTRRARPEGAIGAEIRVHVGQNPPGDITLWPTKGIATRPLFRITYNPEDAGKTAMIVARWFNRRGEFGPLSAFITAPIIAAVNTRAA